MQLTKTLIVSVLSSLLMPISVQAENTTKNQSTCLIQNNAIAKVLVVEVAAAAPAKSRDIFEAVLPQLRKKTKIPLRLPTYLATDAETEPLYATLETITSNRYEIYIDFDPNCHGGAACHHGTVTGEVIKKLPPLKGKRVKLSKNVKGYFVDAECGANCSDSTLTWEQNGYRYSVGIKAGSMKELVKMANSAIANMN